MTQLLLRADSHPYLADHEIAGTPVVPIAMVLEWFATAAARWQDDSEPLVVQEVSVLRKILLKSFRGEGDRCEVRAEATESAVSLMLTGAGNVPHFKASASRRGPRWRDTCWSVPRDLRKPVSTSHYDGYVLFHGPAFRAIKRLHGVAPSGAVGVVVGTRELGWPQGGWTTDPAAIDGGLQIAVLWAEQVLGGATLPMGIREFRVFRRGPLNGPIRCFVSKRNTGPLAVECDIGFVGPDGLPHMELTGVSLILRPDGAAR